MRWPIIRTVFAKELRELLRDRRSLLIMFGVPLILYPALLLSVGGIAKSEHEKMQATKNGVVVRNAADAPKLVELFSRPDSDLQLAPDDSTSPDQRLKDNKIQAIVTVPPHAQADAVAGRDVRFDITVDRSRRATPVVEGKIEKLFREYQSWVIEQRLAGRGVQPDVLKPFSTETTDVATGEQRLGNLMSSVLPLFLLITGMLGAFFPALSVTTTEREHGTLETLLVTPAGRAELLIAKGALVLLTALVTAGLNMLSMSMVMWRMFSMLPEKMGVLQISPAGLALAYLAAVPTLIFFSAIVLVVGLMARTYREASSMATPVMLLPVISMVVGLADPKISPAILVTPIVNTTVIIREVLTGRATPTAFLAAFAASCLYAGLLVSAAARVFSNEQLVNSNWEPLSLNGLKRLGTATRRRLPGIDEAVALWAVTILLLFYVSPSLLTWPFLAILFVTQYGLLVAPTLLLAALAKWRYADTFNWRRTTPRYLLGAFVLAPGLCAWASFLYSLQNKLWPPAPGNNDQLAEMLAHSVQSLPILTTLAVGATAGFCEELLYRGPIQTSLLRRLSPLWAITIAAALFSAAHLDVHGFPVRFALGLILGWLTWHTRSIFPSMLLHGAYDATGVAYLAYQVHHQGLAPAIQQATGTQPFDTSQAIELAIGAALIVAGYFLLRPAPTGVLTPADHAPSPIAGASRPRHSQRSEETQPSDLA